MIRSITDVFRKDLVPGGVIDLSYIREHQINLMLFMSGITALLTFTVLIPKTISRRRKFILALMAFSSTLLLISERFAYIYRGDVSRLGYYMVRISNGLVFFLFIFILNLVTQYLKDLLLNEGGLQKIPVSLRLCEIFFVAGVILLFISQFTGLYYTFDANNLYHRSPGIFISYFAPLLIVLLQKFSLIRHRAMLSRRLFWALLATIALPTAASIIQLLAYGLSLTCIALAVVVICYYIHMLIDINKKAARAKEQEIELYKESRRIEAALFEQTAEALVNSIDAKDIYTHGHSSRVADYSRQIARRAGFSEKECVEIYFAALLHDIGKIGIPDGIINKPGKLTDEEFEQIKRHTIVGDQILRSIKQAPTLRFGAHYHHERYDGTGYPEGLSGDDIPRIARVIAVADAYDAMTSTRSYRDPLPIPTVRQELIDGSGHQFDPRFARVMLQIIDDAGEPPGGRLPHPTSAVCCVQNLRNGAHS